MGARDDALMLPNNVHGSFLEPTGSRVVAEPLPNAEHVVRFGLSEALHVREALHPGLVVPLDDLDAGLLKHDLAHPNRVASAVFRQGKSRFPASNQWSSS